MQNKLQVYYLIYVASRLEGHGEPAILLPTSARDSEWLGMIYEMNKQMNHFTPNLPNDIRNGKVYKLCKI